MRKLQILAVDLDMRRKVQSVDALPKLHQKTFLPVQVKLLAGWIEENPA